jgi:hypothetical protein
MRIFVGYSCHGRFFFQALERGSLLMRIPIVERANIQGDFQIDLFVYRFGVGAAERQLIRY